jgi:hypothetical protein
VVNSVRKKSEIEYSPQAMTLGTVDFDDIDRWKPDLSTALAAQLQESVRLRVSSGSAGVR